MPAAFTVPTGRAHWETLLRARAIENLCYVVAPAQWGTHTSGRETYGDTLIVDYWGQVLSRLPHGLGVITAQFDLGTAGRSAGAVSGAREPPAWRARATRRCRHERRASYWTWREKMILAPSGLDSNRLSTVLGTVMSRGVDYADLYFQLSREESWSLEDGIVKDGSHSIEQGVGVRAISGEKTGFAYTDEVLLPALVEASEAARAIARSGGRNAVKSLAASAGPPAVPADRSARGGTRRGQGRLADANRSGNPPHRSARETGHGLARRRCTRSS